MVHGRRSVDVAARARAGALREPDGAVAGPHPARQHGRGLFAVAKQAARSAPGTLLLHWVRLLDPRDLFRVVWSFLKPLQGAAKLPPRGRRSIYGDRNDGRYGLAS